MIDLRNTDAAQLLAELPSGSADFIHVDAPWPYENFTSTKNGAAAGHYDGLTMPDILRHIEAAYDVANPNSYMALWITFPKLWEFAVEAAIYEAGRVPPKLEMQGGFYDALAKHLRRLEVGGWKHITGGAWGKTNGLGVGFHFRGDAEILLVFKKGKPKPQNRHTSNLWLAPRKLHSEKPQKALRSLVEWATPEGGTVLDIYAGASASMAIACRALGRNYVGAEIDTERHAAAIKKLGVAPQLVLPFAA